MRKFLLIVLTLLAGSSRAAETIDGVAAIVNDKTITYSDVLEYVRPVVAQLRRDYSGQELVDKIHDAQVDALNNLIERTLILQDFKTKGYSFPETVVDEQMNDVVANDFGGDRAAFIKTLQAENMTLSRYREQLHDRIIVQAMRNRKTQNEIVVSPYKIATYYKEHADKFKEEEQVKLRMILIKKIALAAGAPTVDSRRTLAEEILAKLEAGASFEELAKTHSESKDSQKGGDWGWVKREVLRKEFSEPAFKLKPGQHSPLIETTEGYYILHVDDTKSASTRALAEVRDEIERDLLQEQRAKMQAAWVKELRAKAYIRLF